MQGLGRLARLKAKPAPALGAVAVVLGLWLLIGLAIEAEYRRHTGLALRETANLARTIEAHVQGRLATIDATLRFGQTLYRQDPRRFNFGSWAAIAPDADIIQGALVEPTGHVYFNHDGPLASPVFLLDRRYVAEALASPPADRLGISEPLIGRVSGRPTINFIRPLFGPDGMPDGAILFSVPTSSFSRLYASLDLTARRITLFGLDGVVRGRAPESPETIGTHVAEWVVQPFRDGVRQVAERRVSTIDHVDRFATLRRVEGYPLVVSAGIEARAALADARRARNWLLGLGSLLTLLIAAFARARARMIGLRSRSRAQLEGAVGHIAQGIIMVDPEGRIAVVNARACELLGLPSGLAVPGRPILDVLRWQEQSGEFGGALAPQADHASSIGPALWLQVTERTRPNGTVLEIRTAHLADGSQVRSFTDITDAQRSAAAIVTARDQALAAEAALSAALEQVPHGVLLHNADGEVLLVNSRATGLLNLPAALARPGAGLRDIIQFQLDRGDLEGAPVPQTVAAALAVALSPEQSIYVRTTAEGKVLEVRTTGLADGRIIRTYTDITARHDALREQATAREAAEVALRARTEFLSVVSHELRTPLHAIIGFSAVLLGDAKAGDFTSAQVEDIRLIEAAGRQLLALVDDILDVTRLERGQLMLREAPFDPCAVLRDVAAQILPQAAAKGLAFTVEIDPALPAQALGDEGRLHHVLRVLLGNAVKFTEAGSVSLHACLLAEGPERIRLGIAVIDSGIGISEDIQQLLFEPFQQADSSNARRFGGAGLGLALCRLLLEAMGGSIAVESAPGIGSTFRCTLPLRRAAAHRIGAAAPSLRVLLVEDAGTSQIAIRAALRALGHGVEVVTDGGAAIEAARNRPFDLVILDVTLPGIDGIAATRAIRALAGQAGRVPIMVLSGEAGTALSAQCRAAGVDRLETVPLDPETLRLAIQAATSREAA